MRIAWLGVIGAIGALTWFGFALGARRAEQDKARLTTELNQLREASAQLESRLAELEHKGRSSARSQLPPGALPPELVAQLAKASTAQPGAPRPTPTAAPIPEQERAQQLAYGRYLDQVLDSERGEPDLGASKDLYAKLDTALGEHSDLIDVHCTKTLCRARTHHADLAALHAFQGRALMSAQKVWSGPVTFIVPDESDEPGEPLSAWIYLGRSEALPSPDPAH